MLSRIAAAVTLGLTIVAPLPSIAQSPATANAEAQARLVCGSGTVVSATYAPGGLLRVTCQTNNPQSNPNSTGSGTANTLPTALGGTGLGTLPAAGLLLVVVVAAVAGGGSGPATTTTTTTTTGGGDR